MGWGYGHTGVNDRVLSFVENWVPFLNPEFSNTKYVHHNTGEEMDGAVEKQMCMKMMGCVFGGLGANGRMERKEQKGREVNGEEVKRRCTTSNTTCDQRRYASICANGE